MTGPTNTCLRSSDDFTSLPSPLPKPKSTMLRARVLQGIEAIPLNPIDSKQLLKGGEGWLLIGEGAKTLHKNVISVAHHNEEEAE